DVADPRLEPYTRLTDVALRQRKDTATGTYVAESSLVVRRAFEAGHRIESFLLAERWLEGLADVIAGAQRPGETVPVFVGEPATLERLTGFHLHRGALAIVHRPAQPTIPELLASARRVAILEDVTDHTNVGGSKPPQAGDLSSDTSRPWQRKVAKSEVDDTFELNSGVSSGQERRRIAVPGESLGGREAPSAS